MNEWEFVLDNAPNYIYFNELKEDIDKCKDQFKSHNKTIENNMVKCIFLGSTSVGKSTIINGLLGSNVVNNDVTEGTSCVTQCQASSDDKEYFTMANQLGILNKEFKITDLEYINKQNKDLEMFPDINCLLKVYLNRSNYPILNNLALIDCPGYDNMIDIDNQLTSLELIMKYCKDGNIFIFCFNVRTEVTEHDIKIIKKIMNDVGNREIIILFTKCDEFKPSKKGFTKEKLKEKLDKILSKEMKKEWIFYISAENELKRVTNNEFHKEFEDFRNLLIKYSQTLKQSTRNVFLEVVTSMKPIIQNMNSIIPRVPFNNTENLQDFIKKSKEFSPIKFNDLDHIIINRIKLIHTPYNRGQFTEAIIDYCETANKEITNFLVKIFLENNTTVKDANNIFFLFYDRLLKNEEIKAPKIHSAVVGNMKNKFQKHFTEYYANNKKEIYSSIINHYQNKVATFFEEWIKYKESLEKSIMYLQEICR